MNNLKYYPSLIEQDNLLVRGKIMNMKEVLPMWRMCRILKKNRAEWVVQNATAQAYDSEREMIEQYAGTPHFDSVLTQSSTLNLLHGSDHQGDLRVHPNGVLMTYIQDYIWKSPHELVNISTNTTYPKELVEAKAILRNCINHEPSFINQDGEFIYLSSKGENFASDYFGLIKQYVIEMGLIWGFISGVIIALIPYLITILTRKI